MDLLNCLFGVFRVIHHAKVFPIPGLSGPEIQQAEIRIDPDTIQEKRALIDIIQTVIGKCVSQNLLALGTDKFPLSCLILIWFWIGIGLRGS